MSNRSSKTTVTTVNQQLESGLPKYFPKKSFDINGEVMTTNAVVAELEKEDALNKAAVEARAAWQAAVSAANTQTEANDKMRIALKTAAKLALGPNNPALQELGFGVTARAPRSSASNAAAAEKAAATRVARGTMSRKAKLAIHGTVAAEPTAPVTTAAATPAPAITPAK
jgi:hypothetical protein